MGFWKAEGGAPRQAVESLCLSASSRSFWMPLRAHYLEEAKGSVAGEAQDAGPMCASACREAELPGLGGRWQGGQLSSPGATEGE